MPTPPRRRWFRFSLRTMFVVVTVFAVFLAWPVGEWRFVQHRKVVLHEVRSSFGSYMGTWPGKPSRHAGIGRLFGDVSVDEIALIPDTTEAQLARVRAAFPEADVYIATDAGFFGAYGRPESAGPRPAR